MPVQFRTTKLPEWKAFEWLHGKCTVHVQWLIFSVPCEVFLYCLYAFQVRFYAETAKEGSVEQAQQRVILCGYFRGVGHPKAYKLKSVTSGKMLDFPISRQFIYTQKELKKLDRKNAGPSNRTSRQSSVNGANVKVEDDWYDETDSLPSESFLGDDDDDEDFEVGLVLSTQRNCLVFF